MLCSLSKILLGFLKSLLTFSNVSDRCSAPVRRRWALISATEQAAETYCLIRTYANPFVTADRGTQTERTAVKTPRSDPAELNLGTALPQPCCGFSILELLQFGARRCVWWGDRSLLGFVGVGKLQDAELGC